MSDPHTTAAGTRVRAAVDGVARRMWIRELLRGLVYASLALGCLAVLLVAAVRLGQLDRFAALLVLAVGALAGISTVLLISRPVSALLAAATADRALGLADRLTSAVIFLDAQAPTPLELAAIADAARAGERVDPRAVVSLRPPRALRLLPAIALLLLAVALLHIPRPRAPSQIIAPKARLRVEADALQAEMAAVKRLGIEARGKDARLSALAQELDALLAAVDKQELSPAEVFQRLAALEAKYASSSSKPTRPSEQLAAAQQVLSKSKPTQALAEALKKDDLAGAQEELERLAKAAEENKDSQEELARALEKAGRALDEARKKADAERDKKIEELKEEERRLKKEKEQRPDDEDTERRLQKNKRELERLEREKQEQAEQRRQLERLSRELQNAAEQLRQKMSPEAMRKAAEELGKMEDELRKLGAGARAQMQIAELKEVLRRARAGAGQDQQSGQGKDRDQQLRQFDRRAGGEANTLLLGGDEPGSQSAIIPLPMGGGGEPGKDPGKSGDERGPGDGIGSEHDPKVLGERTETKTNQKLIHATGKAGAGPSRSQTILSASERGFSSQDYRQVYKDYAAVVEEVMSQEGVPPGYRYYVKRYFQLIRPRE